MSRILHMTLKRKWFDLIAAGTKKHEHRVASVYWISRLKNKDYDLIHFRNGYAPNSPFMIVEFQNKRFDNGGFFEIQLGKVLEVRNWDGPKDA